MSSSVNLSVLTTTSNESNPTSGISGSNIILSSRQFQGNILWYTITALLILITILTIVGNIMVLVATRMERILHQPNKYFIACLAAGDLMVGIFTCPFFLYRQYNYTGIGSIHLCRFFLSIDVLADSASIGTFTLISCDRYLKISRPLLYKARMTTRKTLFAICVVWLISACFSTFGMFPISKKSAGITTVPYCRNDNEMYYVIAAGSVFFLPTVVTMLMYVRILSVAHKRRRMAQNGHLGQNTQFATQWNSFYLDLKNIRMVAVVMGTFILCKGPFFVSRIVTHLRPSTYIGVIPHCIIHILSPTNSAINPIIYAWLDSKYREALKRLHKRLKCQ